MDERTARDLNGHPHGMAERDGPETGQEQPLTPIANRNVKREQPRGPDGRFGIVHGGYSRNAEKRRSRRWQFAFAVHLGYPGWFHVPIPLKFKIVNCIRQKHLQDALWSGFWRGEDVPKRFDTVSENLRRALVDLTGESGKAPIDITKMLGEALAAPKRDR